MNGLVADFYADLIASLGPRLAVEPVVLSGPVGSGTHRVAIALASPPVTAPGVVVEATRDETEFAVRLTRAAVIAELWPKPAGELLRPESEADLVRLAERIGPRLSDAIEIARGAYDGRWTLEDALELAPNDRVVVVLDAPRAPERALWELRERRPRRLVLTGRPGTVKALTGPEAPLFGFAHHVALETPSMADWARALGRSGRSLQPADLEWMYERTRGRPRILADVLALHSRRSVRTTWQLAVRASRQRLFDLLRLGEAVNSLAPALIEAIASDRAPYAAIEGVGPKRIAHALSRLHELDVLEQPRPRQWQIADPLLQAALRWYLDQRDRTAWLRHEGEADDAL
jgi:hypothetical protein